MQSNNPNKRDGLFVPNRQLAVFVAGGAILVFGSFMSGYFFGKKQVTDELMYKIEQESFADQVYSSLCGLYDQEAEDIHETIQQEEPLVFQDHAVSDQLDGNQDSYYAQLIGFGTRQAAEQFAQRVGHIVGVQVDERTSTTPKGRMVTWYQVVTKPFASRDLLSDTVDRITKQEKLKDVHICAC